MTLTTNWKSTNEIKSWKKVYWTLNQEISQADERTQLTYLKSNLILHNFYDFHLTDTEIEKKRTHEQTKVMAFIKNTDKSPESLRLVENKREVTQPGNWIQIRQQLEPKNFGST